MTMTRVAACAVAVFVAAVLAEGARAQIGACVKMGGEFRINDPKGPNAAAGDWDDDFYDPSGMHLVPEHHAVASVLESPAYGGEPFLFAAWNDKSWMRYPSGDPNFLSPDFSIGFGYTGDLLGLNWVHDIARSKSGGPGPGHLPPPPDYNGIELGWLEVQDQVTSTVGGNGYLYMVGVNHESSGMAGKDSIFLARSNDAMNWEVYTVAAHDQQGGEPVWLEASTPFVSAAPPGDPFEDHVYVTWVETQYIRAEDLTWPAIYFAGSRDGGASFSEPQIISRAMAALVSDITLPTSASVVDSDGNVYVVWFHPAEWLNGDISPDTFEVRRFVPDPNSPPGQGTWYPDPDAFADGTVITEFQPLMTGIFGQLGGIYPISNVVGLLEQPTMAVDHNKLRQDWVYVAYASEDRFETDTWWEEVSDANIYFVRLRPGQSGAWLKKIADEDPRPYRPYPRFDHAMAFDGRRGVVVMHGGLYTPNDNPNTVWVSSETALWDGFNWVDAGSVSALAVYGHAVAYDIENDRVVLFGGSGSASDPLSDLMNETWVWDGAGWTEVFPTPSPPARYRHAMAYDWARGKVVLFGGRGASGYLDDTWVWDGTTQTWTLQAALGPSAREGHAMAYDIKKEEVVLYGGHYSEGSPETHYYYDDTWVWNGSAWILRTPSPHPGPRSQHALAYDDTWDRVVLFGGRDPNEPVGDTWLWNGSTWSEHTGGPVPARRYGQAMAFSGRVGVVLFGGRNANHAYDDVWEWESSRWEGPAQVNDPQPVPPPGFTGEWPFNWQFGQTSQYMPAMAIDRAGHLAISWLDCRDDTYDPSAQPNDPVMNQAYRCYLGWSVDGGQNWLEPDPNDPNNLPVSLEPIDTRATRYPFEDPWLNTGVTVGQFRGMGAWGRKLLPVWVNLRDWPINDPSDPGYHDPRHVIGGWGQVIGDVYGSVVELVIPVPPDYEPDCDVDLDDFGIFAACYNGSGRPAAETCPPGADADYDDDGDVDLDDYAIFAAAYTGTTDACAGEPCESAMGGGQGPTGQGGFDPATSSDPTILMLYAMLYEYCHENNLPFP